jgi:hypothetical protein
VAPEEGPVNVTLSLPPSRGTSRRGSTDQGRGSRRNSLDIYTAEYAVRLNANNRVAAMEQRTAFHMKVGERTFNCGPLRGWCHEYDFCEYIKSSWERYI